MARGFCKANVIAWLDERIERIQRERRFDPHNGTAQLVKRSADDAMAYGAYDAYKHLRDEIEGGYIKENQ